MRRKDNSYQSDFKGFHPPFDGKLRVDGLARPKKKDDPQIDLPNGTPTAHRGK